MSNSKSDKTPLAILLDWEEIISAGLRCVWEKKRCARPPGKSEEYVGVFLGAASEEMVNQLIDSGDFEITKSCGGDFLHIERKP